MMGERSLLSQIIDTGALTFSIDGYVGKSGRKYYFETDLRSAFVDTSIARETLKHLAATIKPLVPEEAAIAGVPETGSLIALLLTAFISSSPAAPTRPLVMLRSVPKPYQGAASTFTVLPASDAPCVLVEDDVVTGATLKACLESCRAHGLNICQVIAIIDRLIPNDDGRTVGHAILNDFSVPYTALVVGPALLAAADERKMIRPSLRPLLGDYQKQAAEGVTQGILDREGITWRAL